MTGKKIPRSFGTHDGSFHADEVTACALLLLFDLVDEEKIQRTRDRNRLSQCEYVCDVGGVYDPSQKLFDHHQAGYEGDLSSAGMVLLFLKERGDLSLGEYRHFHDSLIHGVDDHDNGKLPQIPGLCSYSHIIANFSPIPYDPPSDQQEKAFYEALAFAKGHVHRLLERYRYMQSCKEIVKTAMKQNHECLMFHRGIPWVELFFELGGENHSARFVIMPSGQHWTLRGIPPNLQNRMRVRLPLPSEWAGLLDEELQQASGIPGAIFCHKGRFVSVWENREDALKALQYTLSLPISN